MATSNVVRWQSVAAAMTTAATAARVIDLQCGYLVRAAAAECPMLVTWKHINSCTLFFYLRAGEGSRMQPYDHF